MGLGAVATFISGGLAPVIAAAFNALGISISISELAKTIGDALEYDFAFRDAINELVYPGFIMNKTQLIEWSSGSGNHYTYYTEQTYDVRN